MKKILFLMAAIACLAFVGCTKGDAEAPAPKEASFTISVAFSESGSMSRTPASELYYNFYEKYIKTHDLLYKYYNVEFSQDEKVIANLSGEWDADIITLPIGLYEVTGVSNKNSAYDSIEGHLRPALKFEQNVNIDASTKSISLTALYDCYLLFFEKSAFSKVAFYKNGDLKEFGETDELFYIFINSHNNQYKDKSTISYQTANGDKGDIQLSPYTFEMGKYYKFDLMSGAFVIPEMQQGTTE